MLTTSNSTITQSVSQLRPEQLGASEFLADHGVRLAYIAGGMAHGIASPTLVLRMAKAGLLSFLGTGGWSLDQIRTAIQELQKQLGPNEPYGLNLLCNLDNPDAEAATVDLYLQHNIHQIEASAYTQITPSLVRYRLTGVYPNHDGTPRIVNRVMAKISRPEVAKQFLLPPPSAIVKRLQQLGYLSNQEVELSKQIPMADDLCIEADSGGHTDRGVASSLLPSIQYLRDHLCHEYGYAKRIRVGLAGGLGTPQAIAAAFILGADFVLTGSINQATLEANTSDIVKDLLQEASPQDTAMAPAGDMFELGAQVQVLNRGVLFPPRANKLYELYKNCTSLQDIDPKTQKQLQEKYFHRSFSQVYDEVKQYLGPKKPQEVEQLERDPKRKMARIFRWYFAYSNRIAIQGYSPDKVNFQISCGPALGAFNHWVVGSELVSWRKRHVELIADRLMQEACNVLTDRLNSFFH